MMIALTKKKMFKIQHFQCRPQSQSSLTRKEQKWQRRLVPTTLAPRLSSRKYQPKQNDVDAPIAEKYVKPTN